jgi:hypothetical protein
MEIILVVLVVAGAAALLLRGLYRNAKAGKPMCGCASAGGCQMSDACGRSGGRKATTHGRPATS